MYLRQHRERQTPAPGRTAVAGRGRHTAATAAAPPAASARFSAPPALEGDGIVHHTISTHTLTSQFLHLAGVLDGLWQALQPLQDAEHLLLSRELLARLLVQQQHLLGWALNS